MLAVATSDDDDDDDFVSADGFEPLSPASTVEGHGDAGAAATRHQPPRAARPPVDQQQGRVTDDNSREPVAPSTRAEVLFRYLQDYDEDDNEHLRLHENRAASSRRAPTGTAHRYRWDGDFVVTDRPFQPYGDTDDVRDDDDDAGGGGEEPLATSPPPPPQSIPAAPVIRVMLHLPRREQWWPDPDTAADDWSADPESRTVALRIDAGLSDATVAHAFFRYPAVSARAPVLCAALTIGPEAAGGVHATLYHRFTQEAIRPDALVRDAFATAAVEEGEHAKGASATVATTRRRSAAVVVHHAEVRVRYPEESDGRCDIELEEEAERRRLLAAAAVVPVLVALVGRAATAANGSLAADALTVDVDALQAGDVQPSGESSATACLAIVRGAIAARSDARRAAALVSGVDDSAAPLAVPPWTARLVRFSSSASTAAVGLGGRYTPPPRESVAVGFAVVDLPLMASYFATPGSSSSGDTTTLLAEVTDACVALLPSSNSGVAAPPRPMLVHARTLAVASVPCPTVDHAVAAIEDTVSLRQQSLARWLQSRSRAHQPEKADGFCESDVDAHVAVTAVRAAIFNALAVVDSTATSTVRSHPTLAPHSAGFEDADGGYAFIDCDNDNTIEADDTVAARVAAAMRAVVRGQSVDPDAAAVDRVRSGPAVIQVPPRIVALAQSCSRRGGLSTSPEPVTRRQQHTTAATTTPHRDPTFSGAHDASTSPRITKGTSADADADEAERSAFGRLDALYGAFRRHSTFPAFGRFLDALHLSVPWDGGAAHGTLDKSIRRGVGRGSSRQRVHDNEVETDDDDIIVVRSRLANTRGLRRGGATVDDTAMPFSDFARVAEAVALHRYPLSRLDKSATPTQQRLSVARSVAAFVDDALARTGLAAAEAAHLRIDATA